MVSMLACLPGLGGKYHQDLYYTNTDVPKWIFSTSAQVNMDTGNAFPEKNIKINHESCFNFSGQVISRGA